MPTVAFEDALVASERGRLVLVCWLALAGCGGTPASKPGAPPSEPGFLGTTVDPKPPFDAQLLARGHKLFMEDCAACHGVSGDGKGYGAPFLFPRPRDFTTGEFKLRTTPSGSLPREEDLYRTVSRGVSGTAMPPWRFYLSDPTDRWSLVAYIETLSPRWKQDPPGQPVDIPQPPEGTGSPSAIAEGRKVYVTMGCAACHGEEGLGDGASAPTLHDDWGNPISPRDFSSPPQFKGGWSDREIARTFLTGLDGTPMPSFAQSLSQDQIWQLASAVKSFGRTRPMVDVQSHGFGTLAKTGNVDQGGQLQPDVKVVLVEKGWHYVPNVIHVQKGQVVEVTLMTTDNGLGAGHGFAVDGMDNESSIAGAQVGAPKTVTFRADRAGTFHFHCITQCSTGYLHPAMTGTLIVDDTRS